MLERKLQPAWSRRRIRVSGNRIAKTVIYATKKPQTHKPCNPWVGDYTDLAPSLEWGYGEKQMGQLGCEQGAETGAQGPPDRKGAA